LVTEHTPSAANWSVHVAGLTAVLSMSGGLGLFPAAAQTGPSYNGGNCPGLCTALGYEECNDGDSRNASVIEADGV